MVATPITRYNSFAAWGRFQKDRVLVTRAGSHYKARFPGSPNFVFGTSPREAEARLRSGDLGGRSLLLRLRKYND